MKIIKTALLLAALIISGCKLDIDCDVLLIGDSLNAQAAAIVADTLSKSTTTGYFLMNDSVSGSSFGHGNIGGDWVRDRAAKILARHSVNAVVASFGVNDALLNNVPGNYVAPADMATAAGALMDAYADRPFIWILPHDLVLTRFHTEATLPAVIAAINTAAAARPNVHIISFTEYVESQGYTLNDVCNPGDIHLNDLGNHLWSAMIQAAIEAYAR